MQIQRRVRVESSRMHLFVAQYVHAGPQNASFFGLYVNILRAPRAARSLALSIPFLLVVGWLSSFRLSISITHPSNRARVVIVLSASSDDLISSWEGSSSASSMARNTRSCYRMFRRALIVERLTLQQMLDHGRRPSICCRSNCTGGAS